MGTRLGTLDSLITLRGIFFTQTPPLPEKECGGLLGGVSVIVSENVRVGLQEEANIRMADAVADHLGVYSGFETGNQQCSNPANASLRPTRSCEVFVMVGDWRPE